MQRSGCDTGLDGVVFVGHTGPEDGHNLIAANTVDRSPAVVHHIHEQRHDTGLELMGQVRLEAVDRPGQAGDLGDEYGNTLLLIAEVRHFATVVRCLGELSDAGSAWPRREKRVSGDQGSASTPVSLGPGAGTRR